MKTPRDIVNALGAKEIAAAVGVHPGRVRQAAGEEFLSAAWFDEIEKLFTKRGEECPREAFNFKRACAAAPIREEGGAC